jgi:RNase P protein component
VGGAVRRNKIKRLIREAFRLTRWEIEARSGKVDVVVIPQQSADKLPLADLMQELPLLVEKAAEKAAAKGRAPRRRDDRRSDDRRSDDRRSDDRRAGGRRR